MQNFSIRYIARLYKKFHPLVQSIFLPLCDKVRNLIFTFPWSYFGVHYKICHFSQYFLFRGFDLLIFIIIKESNSTFFVNVM